MMIEVRVTGGGAMRGEESKEDSSTEARCDLCDQTTDVVASLGEAGSAPFACKACLRRRLEAITVGAWTLRPSKEGRGLPWGKVAG